jgi:hypothetical protein
MTEDNLLSSTAGYDLEYSSRSPIMSPTPSSPVSGELLSMREALEDPHIWRRSTHAAQEAMEQRIENLRLRTARLGRQPWDYLGSDRPRHHRQSIQHDDDVFGDNCDPAAEDSRSGVIRLSAPTPPPFTVTAVSDAEESDSPEESPSAAVTADLLRRESLWRAETDSEDEETAPRFGGLRRAQPLDHMFRHYQQSRARWNQITEPTQANRTSTTSSIRPSERLAAAQNLPPPQARFFIAKTKSKITIKFNPAM